MRLSSTEDSRLALGSGTRHSGAASSFALWRTCISYGTANGHFQKFEDLELRVEAPSRAVVAGAFSIRRLYGENDPVWTLPALV
jgi:hypothetical protein